MDAPLLELKDIRRDYLSGDGRVTVLQGVNLTIQAGEMIAIVGASGSGKSTLMNILGCLDQPSGGSYRIMGRETSELDGDELAELRREYFGFIFQRYHLLGDLSAQDNVEVPAVYAGVSRADRHKRAADILARLGLSARLKNRPGQLSGGQQQRVSIARALMNGGRIILADEPTGALDRQSGQDVLGILHELHMAGHTIILVTHDREVAAHARRIIEISDGRIISDQVSDEASAAGQAEKAPLQRSSLGSVIDRFMEAARMAVLAMNAHRMRTFLTMLGIIIGIASVVSVVALGAGSQQRILSDISAMGTNTIDIYPGSGFGDQRARRVQTLVPSDADAIATQSYVDSTTPGVSGSANLRYRSSDLSATVNGVGDQYFRVRGFTIESGVPFSADDVRRLAQDVVIDTNTKKQLFPKGGNPVGEVILLNNMPARIIGVLGAQKSMFGNSEALNIYAPYTTVMSRMLGQSHLRSITVRVSDTVSTATAQAAVTKLLTSRHGTEDFYVMNTDSIRQTIESTTRTMTMLISAIAVISLIVGGIGVMNIMLVSVTERTREIGVRMAVGARQSDVMSQFLIEAVLVCLIGGILGVLLSLGVGQAIALTGSSYQMIYSITSMVLAFTCSTLIGIVFGFLPARSAARLNPVEALSRE